MNPSDKPLERASAHDIHLQLTVTVSLTDPFDDQITQAEISDSIREAIGVTLAAAIVGSGFRHNLSDRISIDRIHCSSLEDV